ncbi:Uncharacterized protein PBTT_03511 [Plasmodiophora brassicae]
MAGPGVNGLWAMIGAIASSLTAAAVVYRCRPRQRRHQDDVLEHQEDVQDRRHRHGDEILQARLEHGIS